MLLDWSNWFITDAEQADLMGHIKLFDMPALKKIIFPPYFFFLGQLTLRYVTAKPLYVIQTKK